MTKRPRSRRSRHDCASSPGLLYWYHGDSQGPRPAREVAGRIRRHGWPGIRPALLGLAAGFRKGRGRHSIAAAVLCRPWNQETPPLGARRRLPRQSGVTLEPDFDAFVAVLLKHRVQFVVVGAFAVGHAGAPRATGDFDVWIRPAPRNARAALRALTDFGFGSLGITVEDLTADQVIQLGRPPVRIDILTGLSGLTSAEVWKGRRRGPLGRHRVFFLGRAALIKNKRAAGRPKDLADLDALGELGQGEFAPSVHSSSSPAR